jgi:hypothetical protein
MRDPTRASPTVACINGHAIAGSTPARRARLAAAYAESTGGGAKRRARAGGAKRRARAGARARSGGTESGRRRAGEWEGDSGGRGGTLRSSLVAVS